MMPFLCWARCLTKPEEVVLVMTVYKSSVKSSGSCAACCIADDFPVFRKKNEPLIKKNTYRLLPKLFR